MSNVIDFQKFKNEKNKTLNRIEDQPHIVQELMCLNCKDRWIAVFPEKTLLKNLICNCGAKGNIIGTGQVLHE